MKKASSQQKTDKWQQIISQTMPWYSTRLRLRLTDLMDATFVHQILTNTDVMKFLDGPYKGTEEDVSHAIATRSGWMSSLYIIETIVENFSIGHAGILENTSIGADEFDFLVALLPAYQDQGYGSEILRLLRDRWMLETCRTHCTASVQPENDDAVNLLTKCGFRRIGTYEDRFKPKRDIYRYDAE